MGSRLVKFSFTPGENEQIETIIRVPEESRSVIHGVVKDHKNRNVQDAVVKLFEVLNPQEDCKLKPITHAFTDECGQFLFGPLTACKQYVIKVWINNIKIRELIIRPDDFGKPYDDHCKPCRNPGIRAYHDDSVQGSKAAYQEFYDSNGAEEEENEI